MAATGHRAKLVTEVPMWHGCNCGKARCYKHEPEMILVQWDYTSGNKKKHQTQLRCTNHGKMFCKRFDIDMETLDKITFQQYDAMLSRSLMADVER